jgi:hypothetical protein
MGHHRVVPDTADYQWLGWLIAHPEKWTKSDLAAVRSMLADQKRAVEDMHPKDDKGRRSLQGVVDELEAAVRTYEAGGGQASA